MRVKSQFTPRQGGADIHLATEGTDPFWMVLRWTQDANRLSGYIGEPAGEGIAKIRPVDYTAEHVQENSVGTLALWMLIAAGNFDMRDANAPRAKTQAEQLSIWEDFLGQKVVQSKANPAPERGAVEHTIDLSTDQITWLVNTNLLRSVAGNLVIPRSTRIRTGSLVSGFDALKIQTSVAKVFHGIPVPKSVNLDQAQEALAGVARPSSRAVFWYGAAREDAARDRLQAAKSFPLMAGAIADNPIIAKTVEERQPLQPEMMALTGLSKGALKRFAQVRTALPVGRLFQIDEEVRGEDALGVNRLRHIHVSGEVSLDTVLRHLAELPPDRVPQDDASMQAFYNVLSGCAIPLEHGLNIPVKTTLAACKGDWIAFHAALAKAADFEPKNFDRRTIALTTIDAMEAVEHFSRSVILPLALKSIESVGELPPEVSNEFFTAGLTAGARIFIGDAKNVTASLFDMSRRYISRIPALMEASGLEAPDIDFDEIRFAQYGADAAPRLTNEYVASNGLVLRPLDRFSLMAQESKRNNICVGLSNYYLNRFRRAECFIYSIQSPDGAISHSTLEISGYNGDSPIEARQKFTILQHRARGNGVPMPAASEAVKEFMKDLKGGLLKMNHEEVLAFRAFMANTGQLPAAHAARVTWAGVLGMDWADNEARQKVWEEWRYIAGGSYGKVASPEVLFREKSVRDLVVTMNPKAAVQLMDRSRQERETRFSEENAISP